MTYFALTHPCVFLSGEWGDVDAGGRDASQMFGLNGRLDTVVVGTVHALQSPEGFGAITLLNIPSIRGEVG